MPTSSEQASAKGQKGRAQLGIHSACWLGMPDLASPHLPRGPPCGADRVALGKRAAGAHCVSAHAQLVHGASLIGAGHSIFSW